MVVYVTDDIGTFAIWVGCVAIVIIIIIIIVSLFREG